MVSQQNSSVPLTNNVKKAIISLYKSPAAVCNNCDIQGCSGAGTRWSAVPANILEPERRSGKYLCQPQVER